MALAQVLRRKCRDDLGIGGDVVGDAEVLGPDQVAVVVDIAIEHRGAIWPGRIVGEFAVDGVGVGFGDDSDAGPTGVAEHDDLGGVVVECQTEQIIVTNAVTERRGVVAELADFGSDFVDEAETIADSLDRRVGE